MAAPPLPAATSPLPPAAPPLPPAAPPPPPPLMVSSSPSRIVPGEQLVQFEEPDDEVHHCCTHLLNTLSDDVSVLSVYTSVPSILQHDKVCGLVAMEMALTSPKFAQHPRTSDLLNEARRRGYTKVGEMFSAENLAQLGRDLGDCRCDVLTTGLSDLVPVVDHVTAGYPVLVPYDVDVDNQPARLGGRKAHWAVVTGAVFRLPRDHQLPLSCYHDNKNPRLLHCPPRQTGGLDLSRVCMDDILLLGKQGKSRYLGLWKYRTLLQSNENLLQLPTFIEENLTKFVIPEGGIQNGLKSRVILVSPKS